MSLPLPMPLGLPSGNPAPFLGPQGPFPGLPPGPPPPLPGIPQGGPPPGLMGPIQPQPQTPLLDQANADPASMAAMEYILGQLMQKLEEEPVSPYVLDKPKKPKRKKPSVDDILHKADRVVNRWTPRDQRMDEDLILYRLTQSSTGDGETVTKNTPAIVVDKAAAMIASQQPIIRVIPPVPTAKEAAQKVEDFLRWSWVQWNKKSRRSSYGALIYSMAHYLCLRGWITLRINYDPDVSDYQNPIKLKLFDPRQVYPMESDDDLAYVVHKYWVSYQELRDEWDQAASMFTDEDDDELVEVTEYYDDWYHCVLVEDTVVVPVTEHGFGFVPWIISHGNGSPVRATPRDTTNWTREVGVSIFHHIRESSKSLDKILSQLATQVANAANPPTIYYYDPVLNASPQPLDYTPGTTNYLLYDRERVDPLNLSPAPTNVQPLMDSLIDDISRGSLHPVLWGQGGTASGFSLSFMTDAAKDQLFPIIDGMQDAMMLTNEYELRLIRDQHDSEIGFWVKDESGMKVGGTTLSPEDVEEAGCENEVEYRNVAPKDRPVMAQMAAMLKDKGLLDDEHAIEDFLLYDNPEAIIRGVREDLVFSDPDLMKKAIIPALLAQDNPELFKLYFMMQMMENMGKGGGSSDSGSQTPPGLPPMPTPGGPGLPPNVVPPIAQPGANPLLQSLGSSIGGQGGLPLPQGMPGGGAIPLGLPLGA